MQRLYAFDFLADTGQLVGSSAAPYPTHYPAPSWAEQQPEDWWQGLGVAVKVNLLLPIGAVGPGPTPQVVRLAALSAAGVQPSQVAAMSVDTTCCTVCALDKAGQPLRPALLWMDMRSAAEAACLASSRHPSLRVNSGGHGPVSAEWMIPKAMWIRRHEPHIWDKAATICEFQDFINLRLTGRLVASLNNELQGKWPQQVLALGQPVGRLTPEAAAHCGLMEGLVVAQAAPGLASLQGGADAFVGMLGLGVTAPGQMALLTGKPSDWSSHLQLGLSSQPVSGRGIFGSYPSALLPGLHVVEGGQTSTGSVVHWFKRTLCGPPGSLDYATLDQEAAAVPPGCQGLTCLDHFQGNRTPHTDALSRGALTGLTLAHTRGHIFRAIMEGVAFGTRLILDTMYSAGGYRPDSIAIAGGATRSELWLQIHADAVGVPFVLTTQPEAPLLGCAILAAVVAGLYPDIPAAAASMVRVARTVAPTPGIARDYELPFRRYAQLYPALSASFQASDAAVTSDQHAGPSNDMSTAVSQDIVPDCDPDCDPSSTTRTRVVPPTACQEGPVATGAAASPACLPSLAVLPASQLAQESSPPSPSSGPELSPQLQLGESGLPSLPACRLRGVVAPSILAADFACLRDEGAAVLAAGAHWLHVDVFDGSSLACGNLSVGPPVVAALHAALPHAFLDCHLAVDDPAKYLDALLAAGASSITFHIEAPGLLQAPPPSQASTTQPPTAQPPTAQPPQLETSAQVAESCPDKPGPRLMGVGERQVRHSTAAHHPGGPVAAEGELGRAVAGGSEAGAAGGAGGAAAGAAAAAAAVDAPQVASRLQPAAAEQRSEDTLRCWAAGQLAAVVRGRGARVGLALAPHTPLQAVMPLVAARALDMVLIMSVQPGWGGQAFMPEVLHKISELRAAAPWLDIQLQFGMAQAVGKRCALEAEGTTKCKRMKQQAASEQPLSTKRHIALQADTEVPMPPSTANHDSAHPWRSPVRQYKTVGKSNAASLAARAAVLLLPPGLSEEGSQASQGSPACRTPGAQLAAPPSAAGQTAADRLGGKAHPPPPWSDWDRLFNSLAVKDSPSQRSNPVYAQATMNRHGPPSGSKQAHMSSFVRRLAPVPIQPRPAPSPAGAAVPEPTRSAQLMLTPPTKTPALPSAAAWPHSPISVTPLTPGQTLRHRFPSPKASQAPAAGRQAAQADRAAALGAAPPPCQGMAARPPSSHSPSGHRGLQLQFSNHLADFHRQLQGQAGGAAEYGRQLCPEWP
ncbi:hypothetical protein QJQ45_024192 [Haematococcus lacustris]|nr:hypothetical protein QJQ45_024192 [Haematococcus lacustris]